MSKMKTLAASVSGLFIVLISLFCFMACSDQPDEISAGLGQQVELRLEQTVSITGEQLEIKFAEVIGDSRCPTGATCIWQGEATGILDISLLGEFYQKTITQPGLSGEMVTVAFGEYAIGFNFLPYPEADKEIKSGDYRLEIVINKVV
jgi:hypothetical protein